MREETEYRPKPLVDIGGKPILWHIMKSYAHYGFSDFVCCLGYRASMIKEYFLNYEAMNNDFRISLGHGHAVDYLNAHDEKDFTVTLSDTGLHTMTGGRIKRVAQHIDGDLFMATYGDGVSDVPIDRLIDFHRSHGRLATATTTKPISRFGTVDVDGDGRITHFQEKPQIDGWINSGFFVFDRKVLDYIDGDDTMLEKEPMERLCAAGQLMAFRHDGFFFPMDTYRDYLALNELWETNRAPWKAWD